VSNPAPSRIRPLPVLNTQYGQCGECGKYGKSGPEPRSLNRRLPRTMVAYSTILRDARYGIRDTRCAMRDAGWVRGGVGYDGYYLRPPAPNSGGEDCSGASCTSPGRVPALARQSP